MCSVSFKSYQSANLHSGQYLRQSYLMPYRESEIGVMFFPHFLVFFRLVVFFLAGFFLVVFFLVDLRFLAGFLGTSKANGDLGLAKSFCRQSWEQ